MSNGLRIALRQFRRTPLTALLAACTLALGITITVAIGSVVRSVLQGSLPYPDPDRLVLVWQGTRTEADARGPLSPPDLLDLAGAASAFTAAGVNSFGTSYVPEAGDPEQIQLGVVMGDVFTVLRVPALHGRVLEPADDRPMNTRDPELIAPVVLDHGFWTRRFGADPDVIGETMRVGGSRMRIVGVLPPWFRLHMPAGAGMSTDLAGWTPLGIDAATAPRDGAYLKVIARLSENASLEQAQADADRIAAGLRDRFTPHAEADLRLRVVALHDDVVAHIRPVLLVLGVTGVLVLLVACSNVAGLLVIRFLDRRDEIAIRLALGAGRARTVRQLLLESGLIALLGSGIGVALALPTARALLRLEPGIVPRTGDSLEVDATILGSALAIAALTALLCGLGPALLTAREAPGGLLRAQRSGASPGIRHLRAAMVVVQAAAAFAMLHGSLSLTRTLLRLNNQEHGFRAEPVMTFALSLPFARYRGPDAWVPFFDDLTTRLAATPGVASAAASSDLPMRGDLSLEPIADLAATDPGAADRQRALHRIVTPGYFETVGIAVLQGRAFNASDRRGAPDVAIVDETLARQLTSLAPGPVVGRAIEVTVHGFEGGYSIGRRTVEIAGVVGTVPHEHPDAPPPGTVYLPHAQYPLWTMYVVVRGSGGLTDAATLGGVVGSIDAELPIQMLRPLRAILAEVLAPTRFVLALIGTFAVVAIGMTAAALFGLVAESVRQRRREFGIRLALGESPRSLVSRVLRGGMILAAAGVLPGALFAPGLGRLLHRALDTSGPVDARALAAGVLLLAAVALTASGLPATRAARADPMEALRGD
ncbi:MAG TPA: ADOP family duplicated permease [Longimicrobiales bacterium]|nr:ADOP family duplicated permease [Longimicrobiales bacterium]